MIDDMQVSGDGAEEANCNIESNRELQMTWRQGWCLI